MTFIIDWHKLSDTQKNCIIATEIAELSVSINDGVISIYDKEEAMFHDDQLEDYVNDLNATWRLIAIIIGKTSDTFDQATRFFKALGNVDDFLHIKMSWIDFRDLTAEKLCITMLEAKGFEVNIDERT